ncbi:unnamed protein product [Colletotrichum noveboracense]|uniref:Cytochrome P450 n=1 Tax=Colletotrichum noveboracense TaxID=2664923 RepID=A0A9W4S7A0_9PEZI|nr:hypothetical protein K456DRAFT_1768094 [Colletotrichum gloeosporioides 23]CAI0654505.1 unnamed protein product [Colletotrichum noveboracense]
MAFTELIVGLATSRLIWVIPTIYILFRLRNFGRRDKFLPPGPPTVPILGNAHLMPRKNFYAKLKEWADEYGSVYSLKVGRTTMIVLNDRQAIHELLNQQGALYNDRPRDQQVLASTRDENPALMHEGPEWRAERKLIAQYYSPKNLDSDLKSIQEAEVCQMLHDLLEKPESFKTHVQRTTASIGTVTLYGQHAHNFESFWAHAVYIAMLAISKAVEPGTYLPVDQFPILNLIPDCWNKPKLRGMEYYKTITGIWTEAYDRVEARRAKGDKRESLIDRLLNEDIKSDAPLSHTQFNNFVGGTQMGAADTTATQILTNILFLAKNPEFQEKARVELDALCATNRLPQWEDFNDLPYINCIIKEALRIRPVVPTGVPHLAKQDAWYKGMLIPKGSVVMIPPSALNHDSKHFDDPESYNPDRYLASASKLASELAASPAYDERDHYTYGAGRRMCPGIHMAERTQWRSVAQMLWAFKIEKDGELDTSYEFYEEGFVHATKDFRVRFVPRSERHAEVIREKFVETQEFLKQWD